MKLTSITTLCCYGFPRAIFEFNQKLTFSIFQIYFHVFLIFFFVYGCSFFLSTGVVLVFFIYTVTKVDYAKVQMVWHYLQQTLICLQRSGSSRNTLVLVLFYWSCCQNPVIIIRKSTVILTKIVFCIKGMRINAKGSISDEKSEKANTGICFIFNIKQ